MVIRDLPWDSGFFDKKIGALYLEINAIPEYKDIIVCGKTSGFDVIYGFMDIAEGDIKLPEGYKDDYKTTNIIYSLPLIDEAYIVSPDIRPANPIEDLAPLKQLAFMAGHASRFLKDKKFGEHAGKDLYDVWIQNSLNKINADEVLVYKNESVLGFVSIKIVDNIATIGLISVEEKSRGQNIGTKLLSAAKDYAYQKNCNSLRVSTQMENISACNFYEQNGFKLINKTQIYHFWI